MTCLTKWAEEWEYASFWCAGSTAYGEDNSGLAAQASLSDSLMDFTKLAVIANSGMILYNLTQDTDGPVTAVTKNTLTATGVTWDDGDSYRITTIDRRKQSQIRV